jgi:hypothetical protein
VHLSPEVQALPSSQAAPSALVGFEQFPVVGSHVPALWHWSLAAHVLAVPAQIPAAHLSPDVHLFPSSHEAPLLLPDSLHTGEPDEQSIAPVLHGLPVSQVAPWLHVPQLPLLHTLPDPHIVPFGTAVFVSRHVCVPVEQLYVHTWQALVGVQVPPAAQATQLPLLHTFPDPHPAGVEPLARFPVSAHWDEPDEHDVFPVLQGFEGWQVWFAVHELQLPLLQTLSFVLAQDVPFALLLVSLHTWVPVEQEVDPFLQGFAGWQPWLAAQGVQDPFRHTLPDAHIVPFATFLAVSAQLMGEHTSLPT